MPVKKSVFGSKPEQAYYSNLIKRWGKKYAIYHNLPFLNIFNVRANESYMVKTGKNEDIQFRLSEIEMSRLKKTSIDFTICTLQGEPLLCIEFDGLQDGFNLGTTYKSQYESNRYTDMAELPWRDQILDLKLHVAHAHNFPFFVVGYNQFKKLSENLQTTIADAIIGEVLANRATQQKLQNGFTPEEIGMTQEQFDRLSEDEQNELIQDWVLQVEVLNDMENNPVVREVAELEYELHVSGISTRTITFPDSDNETDLLKRWKIIETAIMIGGVCKFTTKEFGEIIHTVWLPNFESPYMSLGNVLGLVQEIAKLLALSEYKLLKNNN